MKILVLSDLHQEYEPFTPVPTDADLVVLAGDIDSGARGVAWAAQVFSSPVIYVPGNHEYYGTSLVAGLLEMREAAKGTNVHVLDNDEFVYQGVRFLGATLWTDYRLTGNLPQAQVQAQLVLKDFQTVHASEGVLLHPSHLTERFATTTTWLNQALSRPFSGRTVVVTHHAPSEQSMSERYKQMREHLNSAFASNLEGLVANGGADVWIHGHLHSTSDYSLGGCRIVCNPRGTYHPHANESFDPAFVIEIGE